MRFRPSYRQALRNSARSSRAQSDPVRRQELLNDPNVHERVKEGIRQQIAFEQEQLAPRPERKPRLPRLDAPHKPLERDIQRAIIEALRLHPRVIKVTRFNSGGSLWRAPNGKEHLVLFSSEPVPDLFGLLRNPGGFFWIEVKRPPFKGPRDEREERQARFLECVRAAGGIGEFVVSVEQTLALL